MPASNPQGAERWTHLRSGDPCRVRNLDSEGVYVYASNGDVSYWHRNHFLLEFEFVPVHPGIYDAELKIASEFTDQWRHPYTEEPVKTIWERLLEN